MEIISSNKKVKARKNHICNWCDEIIRTGDEYETSTFKTDYIYRWRNHIRCGELVSALNMDGDEGVTQDDFYEYITEAYINLSGWDSSENDDSDLPSFKDRVEFVYNKTCK